jgi:hypothetical protein
MKKWNPSLSGRKLITYNIRLDDIHKKKRRGKRLCIMNDKRRMIQELKNL